MVKFGLVIAVFCLAVSFCGVDAIRCWTCKSQNHAWCLESEGLNDTLKQNQLYWKDCQAGDGTKAVCRKIEKRENNVKSISRDCYQERLEGEYSIEECLHGIYYSESSLPTDVQKHLKCSLCSDGDFCNSAGSFLPKAIIVAVLAILAKIL